MDFIRKASIAVSRVGLVNALRFIRYALFRDRLESKAGFSRDRTSASLLPGLLQAADPRQSGMHFRFQSSSLEIEFLAGDLVRISWSPGQAPVPYSILQEDWPPVAVTIIQGSEGYQLESDRLKVIVGVDGKVEFFDASGCKIRTDLPPERSEARMLAESLISQEPRWMLRTPMEPETAVYGLGLRAAPFNLRGKSFRMWNTDPPGGYGPGADPLYLCIPVYMAISSAGSYLVFFENSFSGKFSFPPSDSSDTGVLQAGSVLEESQATFEGGMLRYYFIPGPPSHALERYTQLTGRPGLPPRWALGYHQSRWGYLNESDIREVAEGFKKLDMPVSAIHLDIDYMDGFRVFTVDREKFPDLPGLANDLNQQNIHLVTVVNPGVKVDPDFSLYREGSEKKAFLKHSDRRLLQALVWPGWSVFPDFSDPIVRQWWGSQYRKIVSQGIAGIWHDMNEPASFAAWGDLSLPKTALHAMEGRGGTHLEAHNLYGLLMNQSGFQALASEHPDKRPWLLSRSGWSGTARYAWSWTGDIQSSWEALRQTVSSIIGLGLSGVPFSGSDIGGFLGNPEPELYLRWFQMAVFTPFFRTHSAKEVPPREPWRFEEPVPGIIREFLRLRYRLMPYFYTLAWESSRRGWPPVRPLFWPEARDPRLWEIEDSFLLGDSLLVAPVLEPGAETRKVVLPEGEWFDFWSDSVYQGFSQVELPVCLERIPLLVRSGSLLPLEEKGVLQLHIYPPEQGTSLSTLFSDPGEGYGDWRLDHFTMNKNEDGVEVTRFEEGSFPFPYQRVLVHLHGMQFTEARVDGIVCELNGKTLETGSFERVLLS